MHSIWLRLTAATLLLAAACASGTPDRYEPGPIVVNTVPPGAVLLIPEQNLQFWTPCTLPGYMDSRTLVEVRLEGYQPWKGEVWNMPSLAANSFELRLEKATP